uniref:Fibronectin type-III domain-containing protein n=2 Tax=Oryzias latipes TaxID=8090 RepID=A0A3B3IE65_ORYLA
MWSSVAAPSYVIRVENIGGVALPVDYTTPNIYLSLSNLACGERYAFSLAVQDGNCQSSFSPPIVLSTVPCQPSNLTVNVDCGTNNANFSWAESSGASLYTVEVKGANGHTASCSSNTTSCLVKLPCGNTYHATMVASTESCNTNKSTVMFFESAPCLPEGIVAKLDCESHIINVNWTHTNGSDDYTAWAISSDGHRVSCNSTTNSCSIHDLLCGKIYEVAVTSSSIKCQVIAGSDYKIQSYPCAPINTTVEQNCSSNCMTVKWHDNSTAQNYTVKATSASGVNSTCESSNSSCSFLDLSCSQLYSFTVMGHSNVCRSDVSTPIISYTAPCPPTNLSAELNCTTRNAVVSWRTVTTAVFTANNVQATSPDGHNSSCSSMGSSCNLDDLVCGQKYSVVVEAINAGCPGPASAPTFLTAEPCIPMNISTHYNASAAWVTWSAAAGASSYTVQAVTDSVAPVTCGGSNSSCHLGGLQCSRMYNVTVTAHNQACSSLPSETTHLLTEPCPPTNVQASLECEKLIATVSWQQSHLSVGYVAYADNKNGHSTSCFSANTTSCNLSGLMCGNVYSVWVKALGEQYNSSDSSVVSLTTAPCELGNVKANMNCVAHTATASWQSSSGASNYVAVLATSSGHVKSCTTNSTSCQLSSLQCGEKYNLTVKALGDTCNQTTLMAGYLITEPCAPVNLSVLYNMSTAQVTWAGAKGGSSFSVAAVNNQDPTVTCNSTNTQCSLVGLKCSQSYNITVMVADPTCNNTVTSEPYQLMTELCPPTNVQASFKCETLAATVSWQQTGFALGYVAYVDNKSGHQISCVSSNATSCSISGLMCGTVYSVWVKALGLQYNSSDSSAISLMSGPCQPKIPSVQVPCQSDEVQISWNQTDGAVNYLVRTAGNRGYVKTHNLTQSFLHAPLPCGQEFNVTVQGQGSVCDSIPSSPAFFKTGPCIPSNVTTQVQCKFNQGSVSWTQSDGAESYVAVATGLDGHTHQCLTNTTSCTWDDLHCGKEYTVVVRAKAVNCSSLPSNSSIIYTDPCAPQNMDATVNCGTKVVALNWNSPNGTYSYTVSAEGGDQSVSLHTNTTTALFSELICGQNYSLRVTPQNQHCAGNYNAPASVLTWPCIPTGVVASQACQSNSVNVTWQPSNGSEHYSATVKTETGVSEVCTTENSSCSVPAVTCGQNYSVSVTASNKQCNVTSSQTTNVKSVPCSPTNVSVFLDCPNNSAVVSWSASRGAVQYSVTAISSHLNDSCQTSGLTCRLSLACGSLYTVQVVAMDDNCSSIPSSPVAFSSGPCPPGNVSAQMTCLSNNMTVSWDAIRDADHFLVSLTSLNGTIKLCNTTTTACSISNVTCGETFTIQVTSVRGNCLSQPHQTSSIQTAPCQPKGVNGYLDCVSNSAWISWDSALGASNYTVSAVGSGISTTNCTSITDTRCEVKDLACGVSFSFTVTAANSWCDSQPSASYSLETAPCLLSAITAFAHCHNSSILVVWDLKGSGGTSAYIATAEASDHTFLTCNSTSNSCYLSGAKCDLQYTIIVAASSNRCSSLRSPPYKISMEPCPPKNVTVDASCETHSAVISWTYSPVAEFYQVVATAVDGHKHIYNTSSTSFSLTELHCDEQYTVSVTASQENCSSKASQNVTLSTGPCQPNNVSVSYNCSSRSALLTWIPSKNSENYFGTVQAGSGDNIYCHNTNPTCTIDNLKCGVSYNFSVQASDGTCNSSLSDLVQFGGAPCPPDGLKVRVLPMEMEVQLLHFSWTHVTCGDIEYLLTLTGSLQGDDRSNLFQLSSYWSSTNLFEIPLPCSSSYTAMLQSRNSAGTSGMSAPLNGTTAPCPPTGIVFSGNSSFAKVSWNRTVFATTYTLYDNSVKPRVQLCNTTTLSCSLFNLISNNLVITASNAAGESQAASVPNVVLQRRRRDLGAQLSTD